MLVSKRQRPEAERLPSQGFMPRDGKTPYLGGRLRRRARLWVLVLGLWGISQAAALDGVLEVRSAYVNIDNGVFQLHARVEYPVTPAIRDALRDGVTLIFDLDARVERDRRFWFNATIVDLTLRRELAYHAVSDRYVVRDAKRRSADLRHPRRRARLPWQGGCLAHSRRAAARRRPLHRSAFAPASVAATCPRPCAPCCSGRTTGPRERLVHMVAAG